MRSRGRARRRRFAPAGPWAPRAAPAQGLPAAGMRGAGVGEHPRCRLGPGFAVGSDVPTPVAEPRGVSGGAGWPCVHRSGRCQVADLTTTLIPGCGPKRAKYHKAVVPVHRPKRDPLGPGHG